MDPRVLELPRQTTEDPSAVKYLCPFGCMEDRSDDNGYCRHLVGFTDDRKTVELRTRTISNRTGQMHEQTGILVRGASPGDKVVGTMPGRINKNRQHTPPTSFRVYRADGKAPIPITDKQLADVDAQRRRPDVDVLEPDAELV
jgi:hypothetical protein